jgi:hypothetical protein
VDLPKSGYTVYFVHLSRDRLYTEAGKTLHVYSISDHRSPIATYPLDSQCYSGMIIDDRLYLGGNYKLHVFKVSTSLTQPLTPVTQITAKGWVFKLLRVANELLVG